MKRRSFLREITREDRKEEWVKEVKESVRCAAAEEKGQVSVKWKSQRESYEAREKQKAEELAQKVAECRGSYRQLRQLCRERGLK